jgi:hypothetical protein
MENTSLRYGPAMDSSTPSASLSRSFERHLRAKNLSDGTVASYLVGVASSPPSSSPAAVS